MKFGKGPRANRIEEIQIKLEVKGRSHLDACEIVMGRMLNVEPDDLLKVHYTFTAEYVGDIVKKLNAIHTIIQDTDVVVSAQIEELNYGKSLIVELCQCYERVLQAVEKRNALGREASS